MDTLRVVEFDVRGVKPINKIDLEEIPLKDKCPWVIPDGSPFFGDYPVNGQLPLTTVYNEAGAELVRDRDYWLEEEFIPLVEVTGRPVVCFVRLSDEILEANTKIKISYRSVGAYFVPRNSLQEWITKIQTGVVPIPWSKVFDVPPTLPSEWHSHNIKTEIGDWFELTWFYKYLEGFISSKDPSVEIGIDAAVRAAFDKLYQTRDAQFQSLRMHGKDYNRPHGTTKGDVILGNHDNFATGTIPQHRQGTRADLLATVQGVQTVLEEASPDTSGVMKAGLLPLSRFGNTGYIPPSITGSFEGLGSRSECMGICEEVDGRTLLLQNHYDGRVEGLYFSILSDYRKNYDPKNPYAFDFTAYKYEPPVLTNVGISPDAIMAGSGNDIIMVGVTKNPTPAQNNRWFLALTSNTFDPSSHRYIETNMANVFAECGAPNPVTGFWSSTKIYHWHMHISLLGEWAVLTVDAAPPSTGLYGHQGRIVRFRIPKKSLIDGTPAAWQLLKVTYQDYDGVQYTNANSWSYATKAVANSRVSKWGRYTFNELNPPAGIGSFAYRAINMYAKKGGTSNVFYHNWLIFTLLTWDVTGKGVNFSRTATNMVYELNVDTGVMTLVYKQPSINIDFANNNVGVINADLNKYNSFYNAMVRNHSSATVITMNGETLSSVTADNQEASPLNSTIDYRKFTLLDNTPLNTPEKLLSGGLSTDRMKPVVLYKRFRSVQTPIPIGVANRWLAYEGDGENFMTQSTIIADKAAGVPNPEVVCREVSGGYAVRPAVFNKELSPVYSRPLTNKVYKTNMSNLEGVTSVTGSAAELNSRGVECGTMSLSACGFSSATIPGYGGSATYPSDAFRAPNEQGAFLSFPKTFTKQLDVPTQRMMYMPNDYYGLAPSIKDKVKALIPVAQQGTFWSFALFVLNGESGGTFVGLNKTLLYIKYPTQVNGAGGTYDAQLVLINLTVEAPNAAHPGCHLVTDFQVTGKTPAFKQHSALDVGSMGAQTHVHERPYFTVYREGNALKCVLRSGFLVHGSRGDYVAFNLNVATGTFSQVGATQTYTGTGDLICAIPRVGLTQHTIVAPDTYDGYIANYAGLDQSGNPSGNAARTMPMVRQDGGIDYYAVITSYPETGWGVFLLETVEVMFNGTLYQMPIGTIDLRDIDPAPQNKTFWLYATVEDQKTRYIISSTKLRHSNTLILGAVITTGANQILTIERRQSFMIGDLELSYTRQGGSIPVSSGFPQEDGSFIFLKASELLP